MEYVTLTRKFVCIAVTVLGICFTEGKLNNLLLSFYNNLQQTTVRFKSEYC